MDNTRCTVECMQFSNDGCITRTTYGCMAAGQSPCVQSMLHIIITDNMFIYVLEWLGFMFKSGHLSYLNFIWICQMCIFFGSSCYWDASVGVCYHR